MLAQRLFRSCAAPARALCTAGAGGLARRITTSGSALGSRVQPSTMLSVSSGSASSPLLLLSRGHRSSVVRAVIGSSAASVPRRVAPIATRRLLCTPAGGAQERAAAGVSLLKQFASWANQNRSVVGVLVAACCVMYGFYRGSIYIMHFFFNVSDKQIFNIGFVVGILATLMVTGAGVFTQRYLTVNTSQVYRAALARLRANSEVETKLGEFWRSSGFRGYKIESLKEAVQGSERRARTSFLEAPSRRVQMVFMVQGIERSGMISCQAYKRSGDYVFDMIALDLLPTASGKPSEVKEHIPEQLLLRQNLNAQPQPQPARALLARALAGARALTHRSHVLTLLCALTMSCHLTCTRAAAHLPRGKPGPDPLHRARADTRRDARQRPRGGEDGELLVWRVAVRVHARPERDV